MFVESYRSENHESMMAGGDACPVPYPKMSEEDWRVWRFFLPVRWHEFDSIAAANAKSEYMYLGLPADVATEIEKSSKYFDKVEIWRKYNVAKDPIAVGIIGNDRYLVARWGMDKLIPFSTIKKSMLLAVVWKYAATGMFAIASLGGMGYLLMHGLG